MHTLLAGFGRVDVTPMLGIDIVGYFKERKAQKILDELQINALALRCGEDTVLLMSIDNLSFSQTMCRIYREHVAQVTGLPVEAVLIHATHTHTGPSLRSPNGGFAEEGTLIHEYQRMVYHKFADVAVAAIADLKPAKMGYAVGTAPNIAFVRRFRMKDGSVQTNPGVNNPNIAHPIGDVDERVNVLRFDQEGGKSLVLINFSDHPDTVGGCNISADWPGFARSTVEQAIDNTCCIVFNGAQGDVNHVNVHPTGGYLNDMFMDFDDVARGYNHAKFMGRVVAGGVLQVYDKVYYRDVNSIRFINRALEVPSNKAPVEQLAEAHRINDLHNAGKDDEIPYEGMMLTTVVAEAARIVNMENGPDFYAMTLAGIAIGDVVVVGIPGEPFTGIGRQIKETAGWELVLPMCCTNGSEGYFPMLDAYTEGGYEARGSKFKAGVAELIIQESKHMLEDLQK